MLSTDVVPRWRDTTTYFAFALQGTQRTDVVPRWRDTTTIKVGSRGFQGTDVVPRWRDTTTKTLTLVVKPRLY